MKTHNAAVVVIPPEELSEPIHRIRKQFDKKIDRWMPHVNLLYPFRSRDEFDTAGDRLEEALKAFAPYEITLAEIRHFELGPERFSIWLDPEPGEKLVEIQAALQAVFPDCHDVSNFQGGFSPHLSIGQARGRKELRERLDIMKADWTPIRFTLSEVAMISREGESPYQVDRRLTLGGGS